jgi:imidazolonepropionase-like amidohydrolase
MAGTDLGLAHGRVALEAIRLRDFGLSGREAVNAAGPNAYGYLGLPGLAVGATADLLLFETNPIDDVKTLTQPLLGIRAGEVVFDRRGLLERSGAV